MDGNTVKTENVFRSRNYQPRKNKQKTLRFLLTKYTTRMHEKNIGINNPCIMYKNSMS